MRWVRVWLPVAIMVAGVVAIVASGGSEAGWEGGVAIVAAGASGWLPYPIFPGGVAACAAAGASVCPLTLLSRAGARGGRARAAEAPPRDFYAEHGYWPDE